MTQTTASASPTLGRKVVLVVDNDEGIRTLLERTLRLEYTVQTAKDGVEALAVLRRSEPPDLVICEADMPRISGFVLARTMKSDARLQRVPVVFLTASDRFHHLVEAINAGARHVVAKPFDSRQLLERIGKIVGKK